MPNPKTGRVAICEYCGQRIEEDEDPDGTPGSNTDWGDNEGDYGCVDNPENDEDGTGGHSPVNIVVVRTDDA